MMCLSSQISTLLVLFVALHVVALPCAAAALRPLAFAGGFGGGGGFGQKKGAKTKKGKNKKRGSLLADVAPKVKSGAQEKKDDGPGLDRFGLPIPTEDDILPPLSEDTELIPAPADYSTKIANVREAMEKHIPLDFDLFDEDGVEIVPEGDGREPMKLRLLHKSPPVLAVDNFFTPAECADYMSLSEQPVGGRGDGGVLEVQSKTFEYSLSTRTSTTWFCYYEKVATLLAKARRLLNGLDLERMEEPQLVRYRTGEEFSWHYDEIPAPQLPNGGQRVATLLVYLRTLEEGRGGGTVFRDLKSADGTTQLTVRPVEGSALLFFPAFADGTPDDRTLHKGEVAIDEKMIAQIWVHERKYSPVVPEGNSHAAAMQALEVKEAELGFS